MNKNAIEKAQALLASNKLDELKQLLDYERELEVLKANGKKPTLLNAVKKYLKNSQADRPILCTVQTTNDGKQFICNGYSIVLWHDHKDELDALPTTEASKSINAYGIIGDVRDNEYTFTADELTLLKNLNKYIALYPTTKTDLYAPIIIGEQLFDAKLLRETLDGIINLDDVTECQLSTRYKRITIKSKTSTASALILGLTWGIDSVKDKETRYKVEVTADKVLMAVKTKMETSPNQRTVNVRMKRIELINLHMLIGAYLFANAGKDGMEKWQALYDSLKTQLNNFDRKNGWRVLDETEE